MLSPIQRSAWNPQAAAHLLSRAGFGASPAEIARAAARPPAEVVAELVDYDKQPDDFKPPTWVTPEAELRPNRSTMMGLTEDQKREKQRELRAIERQRLIELRAWWLYRMRYTQRPLQEKLTLFWHGHFATSEDKVRGIYALYLQNQTFRKRASGSWKELVTAVAQDPAMLVYLDNAQSRRGSPNENFARELMELFTLGEGHYTEEDIKQSARAFTGWSLSQERYAFEERARMHDPGPKTFFGQQGPFDGNDIIRILLKQPQASRFICRKLWTFFAYEDPEPELVDALTRVFDQGGQTFRPLLRALFLSEEFHGARARGSQVKSPVQWLVGTTRSLEAPLPGPQPCAAILRALGQELFAPPNVKGWDGGLTWISTTRLFHRYNIAGLLVKGGRALTETKLEGSFGGLRGVPPLVDTTKLAASDLQGTREQVQQKLQWRLFQQPVREKDAAAIRAYLATLPEPKAWTPDTVRDVLHQMMSTPQYQLC